MKNNKFQSIKQEELIDTTGGKSYDPRYLSLEGGGGGGLDINGDSEWREFPKRPRWVW